MIKLLVLPFGVRNKNGSTNRLLIFCQTIKTIFSRFCKFLFLEILFFDFPVYMQKDPEFGEIWTLIHDEFERTKR